MVPRLWWNGVSFDMTFCKRCVSESPSYFPALIACLNVHTKRSASPFDAGWYGALRVCFTLLDCKNDFELLRDELWSIVGY